MRRTWTVRAAVAALGVMAIAIPAGAQRGRTPAQPAQQGNAARPIRFATTVTDTIKSADLRISQRGGFRVYRFDARADKRYIITMNAADFDAYVWVARSVGVLTEEIAANDDGGSGENGTDSRLRFKPPANGSYYLVAQSLSEEGSGSFQLRIDETDPPPPPVARPISVGQTVSGELTDDSAVLESDGDQPHDVYTLRGKGQRVRITMSAEDFDTYLSVLRVTPDGEEEVASNDDANDGTNSRVTVVLDGQYKIIARSLGESGRGSYTLSVAEAVEPQVTQRPIAVGETVSGEITEDDPELEEGGHFHEYVVRASAGDAFRITMRSTDFDSFLRWGTKSGTTFTELSNDDDSGGDLDSMIEVRVETSGTYVIRVAPLDAAGRGTYTLVFERR